MPNVTDATALPAVLTPESLFGAFFAPDAWADPYPLYDELRARSGLERIDTNLWVASSHAAVSQLLREPGWSSDERIATQAGAEAYDDYNPVVGNFMLFLDPPDHTRLRGLVVRAFTRRRVGDLESRMQLIVDSLVPQGSRRELDLVDDVATPLAITVISELLGVPLADQVRFHGWGEALARSLDPEVLRTPEQEAAAHDATDAFVEYFAGLITERRSRPADDLLSALVTVEEGGDRLSFEELVGTCMLVLVAGFETTINLIGSGMVALAADDGARSHLAADRTLLDTAVDELLRFDAPAQMNVRVAIEDQRVGDQIVPANDTVLNLLGAANRDPKAFDDPHSLDVGRSPNPHVSFGGGIHHCLGAALARAEARLVFERIVCDHDVELAGAPRRRSTFTLRGYESVPIRLTPR